jgi:hypothetical protein
MLTASAATTSAWRLLLLLLHSHANLQNSSQQVVVNQHIYL